MSFDAYQLKGLVSLAYQADPRATRREIDALISEARIKERTVEASVLDILFEEARAEADERELAKKKVVSPTKAQNKPKRRFPVTGKGA